MAPKLKAAIGAVSEAAETMCGWALCVVGLYAVFFANFSGNGTLWDCLRGVIQETTIQPPLRSDVPFVMRVVPPRPDELAVKEQNHMLSAPDGPDDQITVPVVAPDQNQAAPSPVADAPTGAGATADAKDWRPHLTSRLRTFTVYGQGEQRGPTASVGGGSSARVQARTQAPAPTPASPGSAYRLGATIAGVVRPGISDHVSAEDVGGDGVRNFR